MMRAALRRGGRLVAVTALAATLTTGTAGAEEAQVDESTSAEAEANPPIEPVVVNPGPVPVEQCKLVTLVRNANVNYSLTTSRTGERNASATVHGDGSINVCVNVAVTGHAVVDIGVQADAAATAAAQAAADASEAPAEGDGAIACFIANATLSAAGGGGASVKGNVSVVVQGNADATSNAPDPANEGHATGEVTLGADVDRQLGAGDGTTEFLKNRVCVNSDGEVTDP